MPHGELIKRLNGEDVKDDATRFLTLKDIGEHMTNEQKCALVDWWCAGSPRIGDG
jgi:hypothetical protein